MIVTEKIDSESAREIDCLPLLAILAPREAVAVPGDEVLVEPQQVKHLADARGRESRGVGLETLRAIEWDAAIGVVDVDLFVPEVPFIFGEADRSTRSAIISLTRLRPETGTQDSKKDLLLKRLVCEAIHQIGLIRGLAQCPNNRCVMFYSATVQDTDKKGQSFCANCRKRLLSESS